VFAYAVMRLCERGLVHLDTPLERYQGGPIVDYTGARYDERLGELTARMVLSHTTGLPNWRPKGEPLAFVGEPGEGFTYSGEAYLYLQRVVQGLTKEPLQELMRREVFGPLGMRRSSYVWRRGYERSGAVGYAEDGAAVERRKPAEGFAPWSLFATPTDVARLVAALVDPEGAAGLLRPATVEEMLRPHVRVGPGRAWSLGWAIDDAEGRRHFFHTGANPGFRCEARFGRGGRGAVVMTNGSSGSEICRALCVGWVGGAASA
jgi:CubicO group peptidase (beta-lactamase class C family)